MEVAAAKHRLRHKVSLNAQQCQRGKHNFKHTCSEYIKVSGNLRYTKACCCLFAEVIADVTAVSSL